MFNGCSREVNFSLQFLNITKWSGNEKTQPISWRVQYENNPHSCEYYLTSSENKAWKKFRPVQDLTHDLCNTSSTLPTELTSQLGAGHYVLEFLTFHYWLSSIYNCKDHFHFCFFNHSSHIYDFHIFAAIYSVQGCYHDMLSNNCQGTVYSSS